MKTLLASLLLVATSGLVSAQTAASPASLPPDAVTVVIQIVVKPATKPEAVAAALSDMRNMIKKQPGYLSEEYLENVNPANSPTKVHVVRWASSKYWENVFTTPEFIKLNAAGSKLYTVSASAFKTAK